MLLFVIFTVAPNQVQNVDIACAPVDLENTCTVTWDVSSFAVCVPDIMWGILKLIYLHYVPIQCTPLDNPLLILNFVIWRLWNVCN